MKNGYRTKRVRKGRISSKNNHFWIWALLFLVLVCVSGYFWSQERSISPSGVYSSEAETKEEIKEEGHGDYSRLSTTAAGHVKAWAESLGGTAAVKKATSKTSRLSSGQIISWKNTEIEGGFPSLPNKSALEAFMNTGNGIHWSVEENGSVTEAGRRERVWNVIMTENSGDGQISLNMVTLYVKVATSQQRKETAATEKNGQESSAGIRGRLAICVDDSGYDLETQRIYENMGIPLTLAVMPNQKDTAQSAAEGKEAGLEIILHQPMESISEIAMEKTAILTSMDDSRIQAVLDDSLSQVPQAVGINNHQGSKATANPRVMKAVMADLKMRGLFFFDSRTNSQSVGAQTASSAGVKTVSNELFIDNSTDETSIRARIREAADIAIRDGSAVVIGHCRPHTARALQAMIPELQKEGIQFVFLSSLLR